MNLYQLLHLPLHSFDILYNKNSSIFNSRIRRKPRDIVFWNDFENDLISFIQSNREQLIEEEGFESYPRPINDKHQFVDECSVEGVLDNTVFVQLEVIFSNIKTVSCSVSGIRNINDSQDKLILPIDIVKPFYFNYPIKTDDKSSMKVIQRAVSYLYERNSRYGVITSYEHTYGLHLDNQGVIHITRGILYNETKVSTLSVIWYLVHLSKNNKEKFLCPKLEEISDYESNERKRKIDKLSNNDEIPLISTPVVDQVKQIKSGGRKNKSKSVCSGKFNNKNVIIKKALLGTSECNKIIHESNIYTHLYTLQGISIPRVILCGQDHKWFYLIIERRGITIDCKDININIIACIDKTINLLHNFKILHGDLELRNILLWRKKVFLIDFEDSIINSQKTECIKEKSYFMNKLKSTA